MPNLVESKRRRRKEASVYLREKWGIERAPSTLAKLATIGGGPRFVLAGRIPLYPESELDTWAQSITSPLLSSTSDRNKDKAGNSSGPLPPQTLVAMDHHPEPAKEGHGDTCPAPQGHSNEPKIQTSSRPALANLLRHQTAKHDRKASD